MIRIRVNFHEDRIDPDSCRRTGKCGNKLSLSAGGGSVSTGQLYGMGGIKDHRDSELSHGRQTTEIHNKIVIPEGMSSVASRAFNGCVNLVDITLPSTLTTLNNHAFYAAAAKSPVTVKCYAVNPPVIGTNVWKTVSGSKLYVLPQSADAYKASAEWKDYFSEILTIE